MAGQRVTAMARRALARARLVKVPGAFRVERHFGDDVVVCGGCRARRKTAIHGWHYDDGGRVACAACGQVFYDYELPAPKARARTDADAAIERRLEAAMAGLLDALADVTKAMRRVDKQRQRIGRLAAALKTGAEARRARAQRALATRQAVKQGGRAIRLRTDEGVIE